VKKILVIKHGSLGDIIFALPSMISIRKKYPEALIHLLTEEKYVSFLIKPKIFDKIIIDNRKDFFIKSILNVYKLLRMEYDAVIDLQNSKRTSIYNLIFRLFSKSLVCSSRPFSHIRYKIPTQGKEAVRIGLSNQLNLLNIITDENPNYDWLKVDMKDKIIQPNVLIIPGISKNSEHKQWDSEGFGNIAQYCESKKFTIYVVGTKQDLLSAEAILNKCNNVINKIDSSPPEVIYSIALKSSLIISNDTGPAHIASLANKNMIWLLNDNNISKANINKSKMNHKILSTFVKNISSKEVIEYIEKNELLKMFN
jgi:ADP-heptose:LPS heptosyltransferase